MTEATILAILGGLIWVFAVYRWCTAGHRARVFECHVAEARLDRAEKAYWTAVNNILAKGGTAKRVDLVCAAEQERDAARDALHELRDEWTKGP